VLLQRGEDLVWCAQVQLPVRDVAAEPRLEDSRESVPNPLAMPCASTVRGAAVTA
jgi:hypothetical protein